MIRSPPVTHDVKTWSHYLTKTCNKNRSISPAWTVPYAIFDTLRASSLINHFSFFFFVIYKPHFCLQKQKKSDTQFTERKNIFFKKKGNVERKLLQPISNSSRFVAVKLLLILFHFPSFSGQFIFLHSLFFSSQHLFNHWLIRRANASIPSVIVHFFAFFFLLLFLVQLYTVTCVFFW